MPWGEEKYSTLTFPLTTVLALLASVSIARYVMVNGLSVKLNMSLVITKTESELPFPLTTTKPIYNISFNFLRKKITKNKSEYLTIQLRF